MKINTNIPAVAVIIVNWNGLNDTQECLVSLQKIDYLPYKVMIIDNGSSGNDAEVLKNTFGNYIDIIRNEKNLGYAAGVNTGIKYAQGKYAPQYYLLLNNDTVVDSGFLSQLVFAAENDVMAGIVGPKVFYYDAPRVIQSIGANINMYIGEGSYPGLKKTDVGQYNKMRQVDWVGPCALINAKVVEKIGYFDESYFLYWEDVDFCIRAKRAGYICLYVPNARIWHKLGGASHFASERMYYYITRNRIRFMRKHASQYGYLSFMIYLYGYNMWVVTGYLIIRRKILQLKAFWRGIRDGLGGNDVYSNLYGGL